MTSLPHDAPDTGPRTSDAASTAPSRSTAAQPKAPARAQSAAKKPAGASKASAAKKAPAAKAAAAEASDAPESVTQSESVTPTTSVAKKPSGAAARKPAARKPSAEKPAAQKPTAETPTAEKPAAQKPAAAASAVSSESASSAKPSTARKPSAAASKKAATPRKAATAKAPAVAKTPASKNAAPSVAAEIVDDGQLALAEVPSKSAPAVKSPAEVDRAQTAAEPRTGAAGAKEAATTASASNGSGVLNGAKPASAKPDTAKTGAVESEVDAPDAAKPLAKKAPAKKTVQRPAAVAPREDAAVVLHINGLSKQFGEMKAVDNIELSVRTGSFYGIVGPNGAGKTTTLSMVTGLLRPDAGNVVIHGIDVWGDPVAAKRAMGVLPDRLRLFDRLTGAQLLYYSGILRGLDNATVRERSADLATAFGLEDALNRLVADYSAGMTKKIALACAMIHSPRLLVLDEPFEAVDLVSAANLTEILQKYVSAGGTVVLSSHSMDLIERVCDSVAIIVHGEVLASGTLDEVRGKSTLEDRFVELAGGRKAAEGMEWLHSFSD